MAIDLSGVTIVFDLDGTLVDTAPDLTAAANHVFASLGLAPIPPAELHPFIGHGARAMIEQGLRLHGISKAPDQLAELYEALSRGEFCYVLHARQMGKSSLMARAAARLRREGVAVARLDLTAIGQNLTVEQWYDGLLSQVGRHLDLEEELEEFWLTHARLSPLQRWMAALA